MVNEKLWMGMLAMMLAFGITGIACAQGGGGILTITDIPSRFNGMYAVFEGNTHCCDMALGGAQSWDPYRRTGTAARINNGRVSIPVWVMDDRGIRYNGNHRVEIGGSIGRPASLFDFIGIARWEFHSVSFVNGSATVSFHDADYFGYY